MTLTLLIKNVEDVEIKTNTLTEICIDYKLKAIYLFHKNYLMEIKIRCHLLR